MQMLARTIAYEPHAAIEIPVSFAGTMLRVEFDKSMVRKLMGDARVDADTVDAFLRRFRAEIAVAIASHLFAQGVPLDHHVVLVSKDFDLGMRGPPAPAAGSH